MSQSEENLKKRQDEHDLNNRLAVIKLYAQLGLRHPGLDESLKEGFEIILDELGKIKDMKQGGERFRILLSNLPGMAYRCKNLPGWPMEYVSEGCLTLTGYHPEELIGKEQVQYEELIRASDRNLVRKKVRDAVKVGSSYTMEYRIVTREGVEKWVWEKGREIIAAGGKERRLEGFILDISDTIRARQALQESQEKYSVAFHSSPYAMTITRLTDGYILDANKSFEIITGYKMEEVIGSNTPAIRIWSNSDDRNVVVNDLKNNVVVHHRVYEFRKKNGELRLGEYSADLISLNGEPCILSSFNDITDRMAMEERLEDTREKLLSIFRVAPSGIGVVRDRILLEVNDRICEITGYSQEELIGKSSRILYPSQADFDFVGAEKYDQISKKGIGIVESRWQRKDGAIIHVILASTPMFPGDNSKGVIFTVLDISDRKKAEEEQRKMQEHFTEIQQMETVGRLAGGIAHEFNNALQIIKTYAELSMMKEGDKGSISTYLEQIIATTRQSSDMIAQLLAFARKQAVSPQIISMNHMIEDMILMLQKLLGGHIDLEWHPGDDLWTVNMDPSQLNQVVMNLVLNARDAIPDNGRIIIVTKNDFRTEEEGHDHDEIPPGEYVMLSVSDSGKGMDKKTMKKIFEPFFTTKARFKGTGLGLSTVYGIVKQNDGFISVESKKGKGSVFSIHIPRYQSPD